MNTGLGFSEMLLIVTLILVFFGSKELPVFIRKAAQFMAKIRRYSEKLKSELDSLSRPIDEPVVNSVIEKKQKLRENYIAKRKEITPDERLRKSEEIFNHLKNTNEYKKASSVMIYVSTGSEVITHSMIYSMLGSGKRVVVPYCIQGTNDLGIAEITDIEKDLVKGSLGILEPRPELRERFFRSDLHLVLCPGVAFDNFGARLGRGKAYYDCFLRELKGKISIAGLAFDCQISKESLPFDYHDVIMDQIITESGLLIQNSSDKIPDNPLEKLAG